jgi:hypothetical protein
MRIAYLITAYDQPGHLARLVRALQHPGASFHVHVDGHVDIAPFAEALRGLEGVRFASQRVKVHWMGFSQVRSILGLMRDACASDPDFCVLLSGSDYPIRSNEAIFDFFSRAREEFIVFWRLEDRPGWLHKIRYLYPIDAIPIHGWSKGTDPRWWRRLFWGRFHRYRHLLPRRRFPPGLTPYGGSDWWSLSGGCVRHVLEFVDANPWYSRFYRYTHCPSEMFFQTIILNSPWAARVRNRDAYEDWSARTAPAAKLAEDCMLPESDFNLRHIDWTAVREAPAILDDRDWEALRASPCLFARKFEPRRSARLLDRIDRELLSS